MLCIGSRLAEAKLTRFLCLTSHGLSIRSSLWASVPQSKILPFHSLS